MATGHGTDRLTRREMIGIGAVAAVAGAAIASSHGTGQVAHAQEAPLMTGARLAHPGGDGSYKRVLEKGITFGVTNDVPFCWRDAATGKFRGIDYDITMAAAGLLGITKISHAEGPWASMVPGLTSKRFDYLITNIHINAKRLEVIDFTVPAYFYADWLFVQKGNPKNISTWESLKGQTVAVQRGENYADWLAKRTDLGGVKIYTDMAGQIQDLIAGRVDAIMGDEPTMAWYIKTQSDPKIELVKGYVPQSDLSDWTRFGVRKEDNDLNNAFSQALAQLKIDGTLLMIMERYGLSAHQLSAFPRRKA
jgi:polar amino acid transport system substrate-binding protein